MLEMWLASDKTGSYEELKIELLLVHKGSETNG